MRAGSGKKNKSLDPLEGLLILDENLNANIYFAAARESRVFSDLRLAAQDFIKTLDSGQESQLPIAARNLLGALDCYRLTVREEVRPYLVDNEMLVRLTKYANSLAVKTLPPVDESPYIRHLSNTGRVHTFSF